MISAIAKIQGKQFFINEGDHILVDYMKNKELNNKFTLNAVLAFMNKQTVIFGTPFVANCTIHVTVIKSIVKSKKIIVFKKKRRKGYHKTIGHRQKYTGILINKIIRENYGS